MPQSNFQKREIQRIKSFVKKKDIKVQHALYNIPVCPFIFKLGTVGVSEKGQKTLKEDKYNVWEQVFTGKDSIIIRWENSTVIQKIKDGDEHLNVQLKPGRVEYCYFSDKSTDVVIDSSFENISMLSQQVEERIVLTSETWTISDDDYFKAYLFPSFNKTEENNSLNQIFFIENVEEEYEEETNKLIRTHITFVSINKKISNSGVSLTNFIHFAEPGQGYAFPYFFQEKIILDKNKLQDVGVDNIQIEFFGNVIFCGLYLLGRIKKELKEIKEELYSMKIEQPFYLFGSDFLPIIESRTKLLGTPSETFVFIKGAPVLLGFWNDWKKLYSDNFIGKELTYEGVFETNRIETLNTNSNKIPIYDNTWEFKADYPSKPNVTEGYYNNKFQPIDIDLINESDTIHYRNRRNFVSGIVDDSVLHFLDKTNPSTALLKATLLNKYIKKINYGVKSKVIKSSYQRRIIGKLLHLFNFFLPDEWMMRGTIDIMQPEIFGFMSLNLYEYVSLDIGNVLKTGGRKMDGNLPMDIFRNNSSDDTRDITGVNSFNSAFRLLLSDLVYTGEKIIINNETKEVVSKTEQLNNVNLQNKIILSNKSKVANKDLRRGSKLVTYLIDFLNIKVIGKCDYKITFFNGDIPIWTGLFQTNAKIINSITEWDNSLQFSDYLLENKSNLQINNYQTWKEKDPKFKATYQHIFSDIYTVDQLIEEKQKPLFSKIILQLFEGTKPNRICDKILKLLNGLNDPLKQEEIWNKNLAKTILNLPHYFMNPKNFFNIREKSFFLGIVSLEKMRQNYKSNSILKTLKFFSIWMDNAIKNIQESEIRFHNTKWPKKKEEEVIETEEEVIEETGEPDIIEVLDPITEYLSGLEILPANSRQELKIGVGYEEKFNILLDKEEMIRQWKKTIKTNYLNVGKEVIVKTNNFLDYDTNNLDLSKDGFKFKLSNHIYNFEGWEPEYKPTLREIVLSKPKPKQHFKYLSFILAIEIKFGTYKPKVYETEFINFKKEINIKIPLYSLIKNNYTFNSNVLSEESWPIKNNFENKLFNFELLDFRGYHKRGGHKYGAGVSFVSKLLNFKIRVAYDKTEDILYLNNSIYFKSKILGQSDSFEQGFRWYGYSEYVTVGRQGRWVHSGDGQYFTEGYTSSMFICQKIKRGTLKLTN